MKISEIFFSIQGESTYAGLPFVFVRLSGCNLRCNYCDTAYAWEEGDEVTVEEVLRRIGGFPCKYVAITGGEPLLQEEVYTLIDRLLKAQYRVLIETNGSIPLKGVDRRVVKVVDIKTPGSGSGGSFLMENLKYLNPQDEIKFVIGDRKDYEWSKDFVKDYLLEGKVKILFSPVYSRLSKRRLAEWILRDGLNCRLNLQLHKLIWGLRGKR